MKKRDYKVRINKGYLGVNPALHTQHGGMVQGEDEDTVTVVGVLGPQVDEQGALHFMDENTQRVRGFAPGVWLDYEAA
jgi:hypothetical protein